MKILSLDYGAKRIGLALGEDESRVAVPYGVLENRGRTHVLHELKILIAKEGIDQILIGMPLALHRKESGDVVHLADTANEQMQKVLRFVDDVRDSVAIPVATIDERLSTREAETRTQGFPKNMRAQKDALAAAIILQNYLDVHHSLHSS